MRGRRIALSPSRRLLTDLSAGFEPIGRGLRRSVDRVAHRAGQIDLQHDVAAHRRQRYRCLAVGLSAHHLPIALDSPPASG
jgi:hypothetical protein